MDSNGFISINTSLPIPLCRYRTYVTQTVGIIDRYEKRSMVRKVSGEPPPDKVGVDTVITRLS